MTGTIILSLDLDRVVLPDDAEIIPCQIESRHAEPVAARWAYVCAGCRITDLLCTECREMLDVDFAISRGRIVWKCRTCETQPPFPLPWVRI